MFSENILIFYLGEKNESPGKDIMKLVKLQNWRNARNMALQSLHFRAENCKNFSTQHERIKFANITKACFKRFTVYRNQTLYVIFEYFQTNVFHIKFNQDWGNEFYVTIHKTVAKPARHSVTQIQILLCL